MEQLLDWAYGQIVGLLGTLFEQIGNMGVELFEMPWVQSIVLFFTQLAWALYVVGLIVAAFDVAVAYERGQGDIKQTAMNALKGFMAVSLFSVVPVELYKLSVSLQSSLSAGITGFNGIGEIGSGLIQQLKGAETLADASAIDVFGGLSATPSGFVVLLTVFMLGYAVIKVFFSSLKRGGILLIQIAVGSLYMFSIPRGLAESFYGWCKQIIALCLTSFLQTTILTAGLMVLPDNCLIGLGLMLSAGEIPRIAGAFGLDTSVRGSVTQVVNSAIVTTRNITRLVTK